MFETEPAVWEQEPTLVIINYAAVSFAIVMTVWGTRRIADRLVELRETIAHVFEEDAASDPFREINSVVAPCFGIGITVIALSAGAFAADGATAAVLRGATWIVVGVAVWSFLWTYATLQLGLDRLGRRRLRAEATYLGPGLGLRPFGDVAFMGLWMLLAWLVPLLLTGLPDVVGVVVGAVVLSAGVLTFVLSLFRLHQQMSQLKATETAIAQDLFAEAYRPVRESPSLESLDHQQRLLGAADGLQKRAHGIHDWPIDEGTVARVITIVTSVIAVTIARLLLDPFGL